MIPGKGETTFSGPKPEPGLSLDHCLTVDTDPDFDTDTDPDPDFDSVGLLGNKGGGQGNRDAADVSSPAH